MKRAISLLVLAICALLTGCAGTIEQIRRDTEHINNCEQRYSLKQASLENEYRIKSDKLRGIRVDTSRHPRDSSGDAARRTSEINRLSYEVESLERQINYNRDQNARYGCFPYSRGYSYY